MIEPLRLSIDLACSADHAFDVWTRRFGTWWPAGHSVSGTPEAVVLEPRLGGRIFERTREGQEHDWGEITHWEPPRRIEYRWHLRRDRAQATIVEIRFFAISNTASRVDIEHSGWEALGDEASAWRNANAAGWNGLLPHFLAACR
jgi:uncharacterized protein YndB with AHSA1/START domain